MGAVAQAGSAGSLATSLVELWGAYVGNVTSGTYSVTIACLVDPEVQAGRPEDWSVLYFARQVMR